MLLVQRPLPYLDESPRAYIWRLSWKNGFRSPNGLKSAVQRSFKDRVPWSSIIRHMVGEHQSNFLEARCSRCDDRYILKAGYRVCPICFSQQEYIREIWDYALLPHCLEHGVALRPVRYRRELKLTAEGCDLDRPIPQTLGLERELAKKLGFVYKERFSKISEHLSPDQLQRLVVVIGGYFHFKQKNRPIKSGFKTDADVAAKLLDGAARVLNDCPNAVSHMIRIPSFEEMSCRSFRRTVGKIYCGINRALKGEEFSRFRHFFHSRLIEGWPDIIDKKSRWISDGCKSQSLFISGTELAKKQGITTQTLASLVEDGMVDGQVRYLPSGRRQITLDLSESSKIQSIREMLTLKESSDRIGLPKRRLKELLESEIISGVQTKAGQRWKISPDVLELFREKLISVVGPMNKEQRWACLDKVLRYHVPKGVSFSLMVEAFLEGQIAISGLKGAEKGKLNSLQVNLDDFYGHLRGRKFITIPELAISLKIKQEVAYHLSKIGVLRVADRGRLGKAIDSEAVERFKSDYVFGTEAAQSLEMSPKNVTKFLMDRGINPVCGPAIDGSRQYLFHRSEVSNVEFMSPGG